MIMISGALTQSVMQFSNAAKIPVNLTSFLVLPFVMNAKIVIKPILHDGPRVSRNASLTFSQVNLIYEYIYIYSIYEYI